MGEELHSYWIVLLNPDDTEQEKRLQTGIGNIRRVERDC